MKSITYTGRHKSFTDNIYGSGIVFEKGVPVKVEDLLANRLLRHVGQFLESKGGKEAYAEAGLSAEDESIRQEFVAKLTTYDKQALLDIAKRHWNFDLDKKKPVEQLRHDVLMHFHQYGLVA